MSASSMESGQGGEFRAYLNRRQLLGTALLSFIITPSMILFDTAGSLAELIIVGIVSISLGLYFTVSVFRRDPVLVINATGVYAYGLFAPSWELNWEDVSEVDLETYRFAGNASFVLRFMLKNPERHVTPHHGLFTHRLSVLKRYGLRLPVTFMDISKQQIAEAVARYKPPTVYSNLFTALERDEVKSRLWFRKFLWFYGLVTLLIVLYVPVEFRFTAALTMGVILLPFILWTRKKHS